jgi:Protein of unknown function (DUF3604)
MRKQVVPPAAWVLLVLAISFASAFAQTPTPAMKVNPLRDAYYGDLHLHTSYSLDAYISGTTKVDPNEAYRFAKGEVVNYLGEPVRRREPLDFLAVTDHSENIGLFSEFEDPSSTVSRSEVGARLRALLEQLVDSNGHRDFTRALKEPGFRDKIEAFWRDYFVGRKNKLPNNLKAESASAWSREIDFANRNYEPGRFTTFIAYEWTAAPYGANLHRNVIFNGNSAPYPFTSLDSREPQDLWNWLETLRKQGIEALAIPHNANASNGLMYDWIGAYQYMDRAYAEERQAIEPLSEISQNKGSSETHPLLSPNDEFANYEIFDFMESDRRQAGRLQGSYLRDALSAGLVLQRSLGANPFKYGFVGASDLHSGLSVSSQADYGGIPWAVNMGGGKPTRAQVAHDLTDGNIVEFALKTTSGNLTGVWAESNTRESIYSALRRRETFATSGTRLKFRFFGGWDFVNNLLQKKNWIATGYANGVPMGSDLPARPARPARVKAPTFAIWAVKDPNGANLDRVQVIKVWEEDGQQREKVFDVAWSSNRKLDPQTGKLTPVGDTVDLTTGNYTNTVGATELKTLWQDPQFDPRRLAAYYLRVLEIPTPRWSTLLAIHNGLPLPKNVAATEQQRGWSSPIWYDAPTDSAKN